ncbi:HpcH/HpaI aldolase/citrate lyase family protein [bacterium]|nr:HpcH/HpaI aldolase/citrate lyase family protein [bacterium]
MELILYSNMASISIIAEKSGIDRIMVDIEILGKENRQKHLDTLVSRHKIEDVLVIRSALTKSKLQVRVNPIHKNSKQEIDKVIEYGADKVMLPMFTNCDEVKHFINIVDGRAEIILLLETPQALFRVDDILKLTGIDEIHIGLNDLCIATGMDFMFELLLSDILKLIVDKIKNTGRKVGVGGISRIGDGVISAKFILSEYIRLGTNVVILSRGFYSVNKDIINTSQESQKIQSRVTALRSYICKYKNYTNKQLLYNRGQLKCEIRNYIKNK